MERKPKYYWRLGKIPSFKTDFQKLLPYEQWLVDKIITSMRIVKDPSKLYKFSRCDDCIEDLYLFGCGDDGLGNKGIELQVYLDKERYILAPITVRKVTRT